MSAILDIAEYQLLAEIPNTYVYQGRLVKDSQSFANLMDNNQILDVKWETAEITHSESFKDILKQIDKSEFEKGPLTRTSSIKKAQIYLFRKDINLLK